MQRQSFTRIDMILIPDDSLNSNTCIFIFPSMKKFGDLPAVGLDLIGSFVDNKIDTTDTELKSRLECRLTELVAHGLIMSAVASSSLQK